jgi:hypothetical protein
MNLLIIIGVFVAGLLGLLLWSAGNSAASRKRTHTESATLNLACKHVMNLSQIRQALELGDYAYLTKKCDSRKARTVKKERRRVALKYLAGLREDFEHLMDTAQIVASLSPEVEAKEEWKRFRLALEFRTKYQIARVKFAMGSTAFPGLESLANLVSSFELQLERVVAEISLAAMAPSESTLSKS